MQAEPFGDDASAARGAKPANGRGDQVPDSDDSIGFCAGQRDPGESGCAASVPRAFAHPPGEEQFPGTSAQLLACGARPRFASEDERKVLKIEMGVHVFA